MFASLIPYMSQYVLEVSFYVSTFLEINLTLGTCINKPQYELQKSQYTKALFFTAKARPPLDIQTPVFRVLWLLSSGNLSHKCPLQRTVPSPEPQSQFFPRLILLKLVTPPHQCPKQGWASRGWFRADRLEVTAVSKKRHEWRLGRSICNYHSIPSASTED